jgi:hypothetical protein
MNTRNLFRFLALIALFVMLSGHRALACAACYSDNTGSKMGNAANWGVIAMAIIMFGMLGAIGGFAYYLSWRAKHPLPDYNDLLTEDETDPLPDAS